MGEQVDGVGHIEDVRQNDDKIDQPHDPGFDRNEKQYVEPGIRVMDTEHKQQTQMEIKCHLGVKRYKIFRRYKDITDDDCLRGAEDHCKNVHQNHTGEVVKIKLQRADRKLYAPAERIEEVQEHKPQKTAVAFCKNKGHQPPDLSLQNQRLVKAQKGIEHITAVDHAHNRDQGRAQHNIQHQIGNTLIPMLKKEAVKGPTQIFQANQLLIKLQLSYHHLEEKSIKEL